MTRARTVARVSLESRCRDHPRGSSDTDWTRSGSDSCGLSSVTMVKLLSPPRPSASVDAWMRDELSEGSLSPGDLTSAEASSARFGSTVSATKTSRYPPPTDATGRGCPRVARVQPTSRRKPSEVPASRRARSVPGGFAGVRRANSNGPLITGRHISYGCPRVYLSSQWNAYRYAYAFTTRARAQRPTNVCRSFDIPHGVPRRMSAPFFGRRRIN